MKQKYYSLDKIDKANADYNIIIGERSNGKTYSLLQKSIKNFIENGTQSAYIRRWQDDIIGKRADNIYKAFSFEDIQKITHNQYSFIIYSRGGFYLANKDENGKLKANPTPFCFVFCLSNMEHDKSLSYPNITLIIFDEFITRKYYLVDEFIIFMNVLSTIIRDRGNVKIYMLGNTVNKYCPYFQELGLKNIEYMEQGTIDIYTFANNLKIAVEYCATLNKSKKSNKYFSFDNPRLNMITGGKWEIALYQHLELGYKIKDKDIIFIFCIQFNNHVVQCDVVNDSINDIFVFAHEKTTPIKENTLVYSDNIQTMSSLWRKTFIYENDIIDSKIKMLYKRNRFFYQNNSIGELVYNFLKNTVKV